MMGNLKQLLLAFEGKQQKRHLVMPLIYGLSARLVGIPLQRYLTDGAALASCQLEAARTYNYDAVHVYADNCIEAQALGAQLDWPDNCYPRILEPVLANPEDLASFTLTDTSGMGRREELLKACRYLHQEVKGEKLVVSTVLGPMTIAGQLLGLEKLLFLAIEEPLRFEKLIAGTSLMADQYAEALVQAGTDILVLNEPVASPRVVSKQIFLGALLPVYQRILEEWSAWGAFVWFHILGPIKPFVPLMSGLKANMFTIDDSIGWSEARGMLQDACLIGNLSAIDFAVKATGELEKTIREFKGQIDWRTIVGTDCELPLDTNPENLRTLVRIFREG